MRSENIVSIISKAIKSYQIIAEQKHVEISFSASNPKIPVYCNDDQVEMLFSIFLENALNYSHNNSKIDIEAKKENSSFKISIKDYGIGISEKSISKIFNEYFRSNEAVSHHENGSGLGLAIAQEIANVHDFKIEVQSKLGEGATFSFGGRIAE